MAEDEPSESPSATGTSSRPRRPWLGIAAVAGLIAIGGGIWWHATDPLNPYRNGTTHAATLAYTQPPCEQGWTISLDNGRYHWQNNAPVPASLGRGPIAGRVHILRQRVSSVAGRTAPSAYFETGDVRVDLVGGRSPWFSDLSCSILVP